MDPLSPRTTTISRGQKASMFVGAALFGSWSVGVFTVFLVDQSAAMRPMTVAILAITILCHSAVSIVFGAWIGGLASFIWRSQPGRRIFWRLSGGALGSAFPSAATAANAAEWLPSLHTSGGLAEPFLVGCVALSGMLMGLLIGHAVAWADSGPRENELK
jgi:hypothetical protein